MREMSLELVLVGGSAYAAASVTHDTFSTSSFYLSDDRSSSLTLDGGDASAGKLISIV